MSHADFKVSVLLPTYNRGLLLKEALESLVRQTLAPELFEVVVVDNHSTDHTEAIVRDFQARSPFEIVYQRMDQNHGCFHSMNVACDLARSQILAYLDSDATADPDWLRLGLAAFGESDDISFVAGHIADKPGQPVKFFSLRNGAPEGENIFYPTGNCFYRKSVLKRFGGFDERLSFGDVGSSPIGCADSDLAWRIKEAGLRYAYRRDVVVYHEVFTLSPLPWLKAHTKLVAVPALFRKHPGMRHVLVGGLFFLRDNLYFYLALFAILAAFLISPWLLLLTLPYVARAVKIQGRGFSMRTVAKMPAILIFLGLRQMVICGSLLYGSLRARSLVL